MSRLTDIERGDDASEETDPLQGGREAQSYSKLVWKQFRKNRLAVAGLIAICALAAIAGGADLLAGNKPYYMEYGARSTFPPSASTACIWVCWTGHRS